MDTKEHNENASKGFMPNECIGIPQGQVVAEVHVCFTPTTVTHSKFGNNPLFDGFSKGTMPVHFLGIFFSMLSLCHHKSGNFQ